MTRFVILGAAVMAFLLAVEASAQEENGGRPILGPEEGIDVVIPQVRLVFPIPELVIRDAQMVLPETAIEYRRPPFRWGIDFSIRQPVMVRRPTLIVLRERTLEWPTSPSVK